MRNYYNRYKAWRLEKISKWAQWYADLIIKRLEDSSTEWEFNFWLMKGYDHNLHMIYKYDIYLN